MSPRLTLACAGGFAPSGDGRVAVFAPTLETDLSSLPADRVHVIQGFRPHLDHFASRGFSADPAPEGRYSAAIVRLPRAKALARSLIWQAMQVTNGPVAVDGAKAEGIDSLLKEMRKRVAIEGPISKAHGKVFWFAADPGVVADWEPAFRTLTGGWVTAPGVFSADGPDPASDLLLAALPAKLGARVADLGAGWGYLTARLLERPGITHLDLVEADHASLDCARRNVVDPRTTFHWADARDWRAPTPLNTVVMNPPFHTGRAAEPDLGRAFVAAAARNLAPSGTLWMVANRHLPYESALAEAFRETAEIAGDNRFKVLRGFRPVPSPRTHA